MENKKIGAYTIVRLLGSGGMGQVYEGVHDQIKRRAAIKVLHKRFTNNKQIVQRFINEARAVNIVQHSSLVNIYEFGQDTDGSAYIVMEYLDGDTLRQRLERSGGKLSPEVAMRLCRQIASGLSAAHQKGIIHRDLKPVNIMIVADSEAVGGERAKVLDFGLAKVVVPDGEGDGSGLTHTGTILGTPAYMAPEQCRSARAVDDKSDVYALGIILYEMLSSDIPFDAETDAELLSMHMYKDPPPLSDKVANVHPELSALVHRMLAKTQTERPSAAEVASELSRISQLAGTPVMSSPMVPMAIPQSGRIAPPEQETLVQTPAKPIATAMKSGDVTRVDDRSPSGAAPAAGGGRGWFLVIAALLIALAAGGGAFLGWLRGRQQAQPVAPEVTKEAQNIVHFSLSSVPIGAEVVGLDGKVLGRTPLALENSRAAGVSGLIVRLPGYADARVSLPLDRDETAVATLTPLAAATAAPSAPEAPAAAVSDGGSADADNSPVQFGPVH